MSAACDNPLAAASLAKSKSLTSWGDTGVIAKAFLSSLTLVVQPISNNELRSSTNFLLFVSVCMSVCQFQI